MHARYLFLISFLSSLAIGHPVTYKGGLMVAGLFRPSMAQLRANYTFNRHFSLGARYSDLRLLSRNLELAHAEFNALVWRHNAPGSQANLYATVGAGYVDDSVGQDGLLLHGGVQLDFETRRFYTALMADVMKAPSLTPYRLTYRIGFAPYEAAYDELWGWMILQFQYFPQMNGRVELTPLMRVFYRSILFEVGSTFKGEWFLQIMAHF